MSDTGEAGARCRTCLAGGALAALFPQPAQYRALQLALRLATGLQMDYDDGLPQYICQICNQTIEALLLFRFQSQTANEALRRFYKHADVDQTKNNDAASIDPSIDPNVKSEPSSTELELPTTLELKLEARNKLNDFYKQKMIIPELLYLSVGDCEVVEKNLIIDNAPLRNAAEMHAKMKILATHEFKRRKSRDAKNVSDKRARTNQTKQNNENYLKSFTELDLGEKDVKSEMKNEQNDEEFESNIVKKRKRITKTDKDIKSDTDDDYNFNYTDEDRKNKNDDAIPGTSADNIDEFSDHDLLETKSKRKRPSKMLTRIKTRSNSAKSREVKKQSKRTKKGSTKEQRKGPVKKISIIKEDKRRDFRQRCWDLIQWPFDNKSVNVQCKVCQNVYKDIYTFERHAQRHLGYRHVCEFCRRGYESSDILLRHIEAQHPHKADDKNNQINKEDKRKEFKKKCLELIEGPFNKDSTKIKCKVCDVVCKNLRYFETHAQKHIGFSHLCEVCARGFPSQFALNRHHSRTHSEGAPVRRQWAERGKWTDFRQQCYKLIEGPYHSKSKNVQCKVCKSAFSGLQAFAMHAQIHLGFKHLCEFCARGFPSKAHLRGHLQAKHGLARDYACSYCDYKAIYQKQLQIHEMRFHTKERPFVCDECGSGYFSRPVLMQHIRGAHQKDKPFQCDKCPRKFKQLNQLNYHKKQRHNPTYTFICHICNNTFMSTENTRKHYLKIHKIPREQQVEKIHRLYFDQSEALSREKKAENIENLI